MFEFVRFLKYSCRESFRWILIRLILKLPSKHLRRYFLNRYKDVRIDKTALLYGGMYWWKGPLVIGSGCNIGLNAIWIAEEESR